jgi:hypothetical protein
MAQTEASCMQANALTTVSPAYQQTMDLYTSLTVETSNNIKTVQVRLISICFPQILWAWV